MLILTRKVGQEIVIVTNICVAVVATRGKQLGITAPAEMLIWRQERHCHADDPYSTGPPDGSMIVGQFPKPPVGPPHGSAKWPAGPGF